MPGLRDRPDPARRRHLPGLGWSAACAAGPTPGPAITRTEVTSDRGDQQDDPGAADGDAAGPGGGQGPGRRARRLHPPDPAAPHQPGHRRGGHGARPVRAHPGRTSARPAPSGPGRCGRRSAGKAGTSRTNPTSPPTRPPTTRSGGSRSAPRPSSSATRPRAAGQDTTDLDELLTELDEEITKAGIRGKAAPDRPARRHRSTRRRQDAPDLPRRKVSPRTVGKTYTAPDGKTFRPSLFVTLTCPSYGRVDQDGHTGRPGRLRL